MKKPLENDELPFFHREIQHDPGYRVPEGYFESLPDILTAKLQQELQQGASLADAPKRGAVRSIRRFTALSRWAAAVAVLLISCAYFLMQSSREGDTPDATLLSSEEILQYFMQEDMPLSDEELALLPIEEEGFDIEISEEDFDHLIEELDDTDLQQLLN